MGTQVVLGVCWLAAGVRGHLELGVCWLSMHSVLSVCWLGAERHSVLGVCWLSVHSVLGMCWLGVGVHSVLGVCCWVWVCAQYWMCAGWVLYLVQAECWVDHCLTAGSAAGFRKVSTHRWPPC